MTPAANDWTEGSIKVLPGLDAVRRRPEVFVGALDDGQLPNRLLHEALCCARDEALLGHCRRVVVTLDRAGHAVVEDDGPGLPLQPMDDGRRLAEWYLTVLSACAGGKSCPEVAESTCGAGLAVLNALCAELRLCIRADGQEWRQYYLCGMAQGPLAVTGTTSLQGTALAFVLDASVLPGIEFDFEALVGWLAMEVEALEIEVRDLRSGRVAHLPARTGSSAPAAG